MLHRVSATFFTLLCLLSLACALCLRATPAAAEEDKPILRVGVESSYPPFSFVDGWDRRTGFDYEIAWALCSVMQRPCEFTFGPLQRQLADLEADRLDMVMGVSPTPERRVTMDFSDSFYRARSVFIGKAHSAERTTALRVGARAGSVQEVYLKSLAPGSITPVFTDFERLLLMLQRDELDLILATDLAADSFLVSPEGEDYKAVGERLPPEALPPEVCIALRKNAGKLRHEVNAALRDIHFSGAFGRINRSYFMHSLY